jgi:hypothetical protein
MANTFVNIKYGRFGKIETIQSNNKEDFKIGDEEEQIVIHFYYTKKNVEKLLLAVVMEASNLHLLDNRVSIVVDVLDKINLSLDATPGLTPDGKCAVAFYRITEDILRKMCDANEMLFFKLHWKDGSERLEIIPEFIPYCRLFYNAVYDNDAYKEDVAKYEKEKEQEEKKKSADETRTAQKNNGGCMGVILTVIGFALTALCGIAYIL